MLFVVCDRPTEGWPGRRAGMRKHRSEARFDSFLREETVCVGDVCIDRSHAGMSASSGLAAVHATARPSGSLLCCSVTTVRKIYDFPPQRLLRRGSMRLIDMSFGLKN